MNHLLNFFPIINQQKLSLNYSLIEIGSIPEGVDLPHNLQLIRSHVQREYGTPATSIIRDGKRFLAVGTKPKKKPYPVTIEAPILQGLVVPLKLISGTTKLNLAGTTEEAQQITTNFLNFELRSALRSDEERLWKGNSPYIFYTKRPIRLSKNGNDVDLYPGFACRVQFVPDVGFGLVVDTLSIFVDAKTLAERKTQGEDWRNLVGRHFVYEFGSRWYFIQLKNVEKKTIAEAQFSDPRSGATINLFDYLGDRWKDYKPERLQNLKQDDLAVTYGSASHQGERYAAASLIRLRYKTSEEPAQDHHKESIVDVDDKMQDLQTIIDKYLNNKVKLEGNTLNITDQPASIPYHVFPIPSQRFGQDRVMPRPQTDPQKIKDSWRRRKNWLEDPDIRIYSRDGAITSQFFMMPSSLTNDEDVADQIEQDIKEAVQKYCPVPYNPKLVVWDDENAQSVPLIREAIDELKKSMIEAGNSCVVVVLPSRRAKVDIGKMRRHIKKFFSPEIRTKCVQASELIRLMEIAQKGDSKDVGRYQSYLTFTALDILVTSGYRLWVLNEPLNYDLYIGIDVLNNIAGFTFVAAGGAICRFIPSHSDQKEQLSAEQVADVLGKHFREIIPRFKEIMGRLPKHIVVHRDGRWYNTESQGFNFITDQLFHEKLLPENVVKGVVEIQKTNAQRWRVFAHDKNRFQNPLVGTYYIFARQRGIICTTGRPANIPGTSQPLLVNIVEGNLDMEKVLRDIYWLSILAWSKPDGVQSLPITIKLADAWLEPLGMAIDENEALFEALQDKLISAK
ncbi:MAG: hypothetical protein K8L97_23470 [Anaerolineae bacterium]|nr:hypothetical protein [Anaerolineae bacterium]